MITKRSSPHFLRNKLIKNKEAYVESVGKLDLETLSEVRDAQDGKGTVLRLIMGATQTMPLRALTYVDAALRCAQAMPFEQLQIIHANEIGHVVNAVPREEAAQQAVLLAHVARMHIRAVAPDLSGKVLHASDTPLDLGSCISLARMVFNTNPELAQLLNSKGEKHGGNSEQYTAAHFAFQDTDQMVLDPLFPSEAPMQAKAERIVSIGCLQERPFYLARMAMRELCCSSGLVASAQIFTKHASPPYFVARHGEPLLEDALRDGFSMEGVGDAAAARDLQHFVSTINRKEI